MFLPAIDQEAYNLFDEPQLTGTPERRLLLAILERAILDYVGNDPEEMQLAGEWLFDREENDGESLSPFSFLWLCQELDLDAEEISATIRAMPRRGKNRVAPWYFAREVLIGKKALNSSKPTASAKREFRGEARLRIVH